MFRGYDSVTKSLKSLRLPRYLCIYIAFSSMGVETAIDVRDWVSGRRKEVMGMFDDG